MNSFISKYWLVGIVIFLLIISISFKVSSFVVTDESIVITFIGILATFIVISNYAQVQDIKKEFENRIKGLRDEITKVTEIQGKFILFLTFQFEDLLSNNKVIEAYNFFFENYTKDFELATLNILWKYFGGMYIGTVKTEEKKQEYKKEYEKNFDKAKRLNVSKEFINYMRKAFLSDGKYKMFYGTLDDNGNPVDIEIKNI